VTVSENTFGDAPTISAIFAYRTLSELAVPEPSTWAMLLLGAGGLAIGGGLRARRALGGDSRQVRW
jgi:PEP-CTERM motif